MKSNKIYKTNRFLLFLFVLEFSTNFSFAQSGFHILDKEENLLYESELLYLSDTFHSSIYPRRSALLTNYESIQMDLKASKKENLWNQYPIELFKNTTRIIPLLQMGLSKDFNRPTAPYQNGGGVLLHSDMGKKVSIQFAVYGAQERFGIEDQKQIDSTGILPHIGPYNAKKNDTYIYTNWEGYISYQAASFLNIQAGKDQNFIGDGNRSILLSDNSSPYPFIKATVYLGKIHYLVLYQFLKDVDTDFYNYPQEQKYSTSHFLSLNLGQRFNFNLFETVVWRDQLDDGGKRGYDFNYINPIIFFRPVEFSIGSPDNVLLGGGYRIRFFKTTHLYGQLILDEFKLSEIKARNGWWANKYGFQLGMKIYDLFSVKNLFILGEYNTVRPYTYSHDNSMENYGNMYQPLAHPYGSNFKELIGLVHYSKKRWLLQAKLSVSQMGIDMDSLNQGQNIYRSYNDNRKDYGNETLQGLKTRIITGEVKLAYVINPLWNLRLETGIQVYKYANAIESKQQNYMFLRLKTLF